MKQVLKIRDCDEVDDVESVECPECCNTAHYMRNTSTFLCCECEWESDDLDNLNVVSIKIFEKE